MATNPMPPAPSEKTPFLERISSHLSQFQDSVLGFFFAPVCRYPSNDPGNFRVFIKVSPCSIAEVEWPAVVGDARCFPAIGSVENPDAHQFGDNARANIKILAAGTPLYVATDEGLLLCGHIPQPMPYRVVRAARLESVPYEVDELGKHNHQGDQKHKAEPGAETVQAHEVHQNITAEGGA